MPPLNFLKRKRQKGISLVELLLAIGIIAVLMTGGGMGYINLKQRAAIDKDATLIVAELRNTLAMARSNQDGSSWGIKFVKAQDGDYYQILKDNEDTAYKTVYLDSQVDFGSLYDPDEGDTQTEIISEMFVGGPTLSPLPGTAIIELVVEQREDLKDTITISKAGLVSRESSYKQKKDGSESVCGSGDKVLLCHQSAQGWQEITVDEESLDSHLEHGDYCGPCE